MSDFRKRVGMYKGMPFGYYHLCTDGWQDGKLFHTEKQFAQGMTTLALSTLKNEIRIIGAELMKNHYHEVLAGTGAACVASFFFCVRRINKQLVEDGYPPLPDDYGFKLIPIDSVESMRAHLVYLARNAFEKGLCVPNGHKWGTAYLCYNELAPLIRGRKVKDLSQNEVWRLTKSKMILPPDWEIHPDLGILPSGYIQMNKVREFFPSVKDFMTSLVKDYEAFVRVSDSVGETVEWSLEEARDIVRQEAEKEGTSLNGMSNEQKCRLAVRLAEHYHLSTKMLAQSFYISERIIAQALNSKEYGIRKK